MPTPTSSSPRLLVIGGTGFIGRHVVAAGVAKGWNVTSLSLKRQVALSGSPYRTVFADVTSPTELAATLQAASFEYVVYCGGYVDHAGFFNGGSEAMLAKGLGVFNLVGLLDRSALRGFINIGSSEEYGTANGPVREEQVGRPLTPYALSHLNVTKFLEMLHEAEDFPATTLRLFQAYGPGQLPPRLVPSVIASCFNNEAFPLTHGAQVRDFCYIDDVVLAVFAAMDQPRSVGGVFNVATGQPTTVKHVVERIVALMGQGSPNYGEIEVRAHEPPSQVADVTRVGAELGWSAQVALDDGLTRTIQWFQSQQRDTVSGGRPTQGRSLIRVSRSVLGAGERRSVMRVLDREFLGMGADVRTFEEALTRFFGRPAVCVVNGTAALHLAVQACGIGPGDEVLVPSLTYVATFQAVSATGARPVACEVVPNTCGLDWRDAERRVTPRTKAVVPVHYGGGVGDLDGIYGFAARHGLRVIEDAAHAIGSTHHGKIVGGFGDIACFSFDGIKNITSGEGGCVLSDDSALIARVRDARLLGVEHDTERRYEGQRSWEFDVRAQGWRYHMSNIMAAIGVEQLERFEETSARRQQLAWCYAAILADHPRIRPILSDFSTVVPHIYVVRITGLTNRHELREQLLNAGIQTGIHYQPNHQLSLYRDDTAAPLPVTEALFPELLTLPLHGALTETDVRYVCTTLNELLQ